jgi:hypothetical protein
MYKYFYTRNIAKKYTRFAMLGFTDKHIIGVSENCQPTKFARGSSYLIMNPEEQLKAIYNIILNTYQDGVKSLDNMGMLLENSRELHTQIKEYIALHDRLKKDKASPHLSFYKRSYDKLVPYTYDCYLTGKSIYCSSNGLGEERDRQWDKIKNLIIDDASPAAVSVEMGLYLSIEKAIKELEDE